LKAPAHIPGTASFHTHRLDERRVALAGVFSKATMQYVWGKYVHRGMREQEILDLHDYVDFHWGRAELFENLHAEIMGGHYRPQRSMPVRVEKNNGVSRVLVVPAPEDAVVLQCLVEHILPVALRRQPSRNGFFSRSHTSNVGKFAFHKDYVWFRRWVQFSKIRVEIASIHSYVCVTDVANFFDNIDYRHLRNMMSVLDGFNEVILDVLIMVLDEVGWRPDYLPPPNRSLPQVNFDAPRLLAHIYMFETDAFLQRVSADSFVRWVDDITVAVDSEAKGKALLQDLDQLLMTRGLRLNGAKTKILSAKNARRFFHVSENGYLDKESALLANKKISEYRISLLKNRVRKRFSGFLNQQEYGQYDKIIKRYLGIFTQLKDEYAVSYCMSELPRNAAIRDSIWRYLSDISPSAMIFNNLRSYLLGDSALDDSSVFHIAKLFTEWHISPGSRMQRNMRYLAELIAEPAFTRKSKFYFVASLWILAKYGKKAELGDVVAKHRVAWRTSEFLSRQVAATLPKFRGDRQGREIQKLLERHKFRSAVSVISSIKNMRSDSGNIRSDVRLYILNGRQKSAYSIQRFLIAINVLTDRNCLPPQRRKLRDDLLKYVDDPLYRRVLLRLNL
jgi:hypothetical protein